MTSIIKRKESDSQNTDENRKKLKSENKKEMKIHDDNDDDYNEELINLKKQLEEVERSIENKSAALEEMNAAENAIVQSMKKIEEEKKQQQQRLMLLAQQQQRQMLLEQQQLEEKRLQEEKGVQEEKRAREAAAKEELEEKLRKEKEEEEEKLRIKKLKKSIIIALLNADTLGTNKLKISVLDDIRSLIFENDSPAYTCYGCGEFIFVNDGEVFDNFLETTKYGDAQPFCQDCSIYCTQCNLWYCQDRANYHEVCRSKEQTENNEDDLSTNSTTVTDTAANLKTDTIIENKEKK